MIFDTHSKIALRQYGKVSWQKGYWDDGRINTTYHLLMYVDGGSFKMKIENKVYSCSTGDFLFIPCGVHHKPLESEGTSYLYFEIFPQVINTDNINTATKIVGAKYKKPIQYPGTNEVRTSYNFNYYRMALSPYITLSTLTHCLDNIPVQKVIRRISELNVLTNPGIMILAEQFLRELLVLISAEINENRYSKALNMILEYISTHFAENITLKGLSKRFSLSESYIARLFKTQLGTTLSEYVNTLRIQFACSLLKNTDMKLSEIAEKSGYNNQYYFSRIFKKLNGITPIKYKKND